MERKKSYGIGGKPTSPIGPNSNCVVLVMRGLSNKATYILIQDNQIEIITLPNLTLIDPQSGYYSLSDINLKCGTVWGSHKGGDWACVPSKTLDPFNYGESRVLPPFFLDDVLWKVSMLPCKYPSNTSLLTPLDKYTSVSKTDECFAMVRFKGGIFV